MAIVRYREGEVPEMTGEETAVMLADTDEDPTEADLEEIPAMTDEELGRMIPWSQRHSARTKQPVGVG